MLLDWERPEQEVAALVTVQSRRDGPAIVSPQMSANGTWTVQLSPKVLTELRIKTGASELDLNLRDLKVTVLDVDSGVSGTNIVLPEPAGETSAHIKTGVSGVEVTIPQDVSARIQVRRGLTGITIGEGRFPKVSGNLYQSRDYDKAENRVDLEIETGVGPRPCDAVGPGTASTVERGCTPSPLRRSPSLATPYVEAYIVPRARLCHSSCDC